MRWLADHMGHNLDVHRNYYRLKDSTVELSKVARLLLVIDEGRANKFAKKKLSEIDVQGTFYDNIFLGDQWNTYKKNWMRNEIRWRHVLILKRLYFSIRFLCCPLSHTLMPIIKMTFGRTFCLTKDPQYKVTCSLEYCFIERMMMTKTRLTFLGTIWSSDEATSTITHLFCFFLTTITSGLLCSATFSHCILKSDKTLNHWFSNILRLMFVPFFTSVHVVLSTKNLSELNQAIRRCYRLRWFSFWISIIHSLTIWLSASAIGT